MRVWVAAGIVNSPGKDVLGIIFEVMCPSIIFLDGNENFWDFIDISFVNEIFGDYKIFNVRSLETSVSLFEEKQRIAIEKAYDFLLVT